MSTKVKGEAIKEGSIPLSALADDAKNIPNLGITIQSLDFTLSEEETERTLKILHLYNGNLIKIPFSYDAGELIIEGDHIFFINKMAGGLNDFLLKCLDLNMYISVSTEGLSTYRTIIEEISYPTPDWNAQEGEAGYINNRTHYLSDKIGALGNGISKIPYEPAYYIRFDTTIMQIPPFEEGLQITIKSGPPVFIKYVVEESNRFVELIDVANYFKTNVIEFYQNLTTIDPIFIPDTILKTTPQSLSDTDKNQALANLGIDPVVWKYMMNPHIVDYESDSGTCSNPIPKELSDIIYQNGRFNHLVLSTVLIKIYEESEGGDLYWRVERITSYDEYGNVIFNGDELSYDTDTRLFIV